MRIPDNGNKCVAFLGVMEGQKFVPKATAFFVTYQYKQHYWRFIVTAEHVISGLLGTGKQLYIRVNLLNGEVLEASIAHDSWQFYPDQRNPSDVAVSPFSASNKINMDDGSSADLDILTISINGESSIAATQQTMTDRRMGVGEEIFAIGLFKSHFGRQQNVPIVRTGNIAAMRGEPVFTKWCGYTDAYLIEARSIGGLSGSPVFVHPPYFRLINGNVETSAGFPQVQLLGLMHGHFDVTDLTADVVADAEPGAASGIHTGIGVVIPVEKIIETIEQPDMLSFLDRHLDDLKRSFGATPDAKEP